MALRNVYATDNIADAPDLSDYGTVSGEGAYWNASGATAKPGEQTLLGNYTYRVWVSFIVANPGAVSVNQVTYGSSGQDVGVHLVKGPADGSRLTAATLASLGQNLGYGDDNAGNAAGYVNYTATPDDVGRWFYAACGMHGGGLGGNGTIAVTSPVGVLGTRVLMKPMRVVSGVAVPSYGQLWPRGSRAR